MNPEQQKAELLEKLRKAGVTDLESLAELAAKLHDPPLV